MRQHPSLVALSILALAHLGCSGSASSDPVTTTSLTAAECGALADQIGEETRTAGSCTVAVRLDYSSLKVLGHASYCGPLVAMDEQAATAIASQALMGGLPPSLMAGSGSGNWWVFRSVLGDFGHATAISATNGLTVFDGALDWGGVLGEGGGARGGSLALQPSENHGDLGGGCAAAADVALPMQSFDLREGAGTPAARPDAALKIVLGTTLPAGVQRWGSLRDAVVLTYAGREPDAPNDWRSEYVVLLNAVASGT